MHSPAQQYMQSSALSSRRMSTSTTTTTNRNSHFMTPTLLLQVVMEIPESVAVTSIDAEKHPLVGPIAQECSELVAITLWLMAERSSSGSSWSALLAALPEQTMSPILWEDAELQELLQGSPVQEEARTRRQQLQQQWQVLYEKHFAADSSRFDPGACARPELCGGPAGDLLHSCVHQLRVSQLCHHSNKDCQKLLENQQHHKQHHKQRAEAASAVLHSSEAIQCGQTCCHLVLRMTAPQSSPAIRTCARC